ncbi:MAG: carboxymuconolactone decarboxylase family protein [Hyphomicrobiaceae bacterium]|jgi:AhpD family alkylhydroperoxidase
MHAQRMNYRAASPATYEAIAAAEAHIRKCGLEHSLIELVKMRASQINHCAYCLDRHSKDAREHGETEQRLYLLNAWEEASCYTPRERAALGWTDSLTLLPSTGAPDADYGALKPHFTDKEIVDLTVLIGLINLWNRIGVGFRLQHPK